MNETAIIVDGLGKRYRLGGARKTGRSLKEALTQAAATPFRRRTPSGYEEFWALKDVSFQVPQGEVLGIVGSNGAGKSTLLKILSRITDPTVGHAEIRGRLGSLLEVGTGFHPELTGRENVYLNGAILGMKRREIDDSFDKIVDFAAVERFIDTPVKHYSSGMYVRLAFAVAAHLEPEILIVDEVLAVGDMAFQARCIQHFRNMCERGKTVLLISHNMAVVKQICSRALLLDAGALIGDGHPSEMIERYTSLQRENGRHLQAQRKLQQEDPVRWGSGAVAITRVYTSRDGVETHIFGRGQQIELVLEFETLESPGHAVVGFAINNSAGLPVFSSNSSELGTDMPALGTRAQYRATFRIENVFGDDTYSVSCAVNNPDRTRPYARLENVHLFEVDGNSKRSPVWPRHDLSLVRIDE